MLGRFISKDPFPGFVELPGSLNPYSYAYNNPVNLTDPSGHFAPLLIPLILGGAIGGGFAAVAYMQAHPCADFWSDRDFQRTVGVGILSGMAGAAVGLTMGLIGVPGGLGGAIVYGMIVGSASGVATQMTANALTERPLHEGVLEAAVMGAASGGLSAGIGYHISLRPVNTQGVPYPDVYVEGYGKVPFPEGSYTPHDPATYAQLREEFEKKIQKQFLEWWTVEKGRPLPPDPQVHHIQPLSRGGGNDFDNLVPLQATPGRNNIHNLFTQWWNHFP